MCVFFEKTTIFIIGLLYHSLLNKNMKTFLLFIFTCFFYHITFAQAPYSIDQNNNQCCGGDNNGMGSSFLTSFSGQLDSVDVFMRNGNTTTGTLKIFMGNSNSNGDLLYTQALTDVPMQTINTPYTIRLTTPVVLNANSTYTFMFYNAPIRYGNSDVYAYGSMWTGQGFLSSGEHVSSDVDFITYIGALNATSTEDPLVSADKYISYVDRVIKTNNFKADEIIVSTTTGKLVAQGQDETLHLDQNIKSGIYVIRVRRAQEVFTKKIFIP